MRLIGVGIVVVVGAIVAASLLGPAGDPERPVVWTQGEHAHRYGAYESEPSSRAEALWRDHSNVVSPLVSFTRGEVLQAEGIIPFDRSSMTAEERARAMRLMQARATFSARTGAIERALELGDTGRDPRELAAEWHELRAAWFDEATTGQGIPGTADAADPALASAPSIRPRDDNLGWIGDRVLFQRHGGRVVERRSPAHPDILFTIFPVDAYRAHLEEREKAGEFSVPPGFGDRFWRVFDVMPIDTVLPDPDAYYETEPHPSEISTVG